MNVDMDEDNQGGVNPTHNGDINGGTVTSGTNTSCVYHSENESSQQNNNNLEEQVVNNNKKAKLDEKTSAPTSVASAIALRHKSPNNKPLSPSKLSFPNATNHNSLLFSSTSPRLGFGLLKDDGKYEQGSINNKAAATDSGYYSNSYDKDAELQQHHFPNAETQLNNNYYLSSSTSSTTGVYERALAIQSGSNNKAAATDSTLSHYFSVYQLPKKKSSKSRKKKSNPKSKLDDAHLMNMITRDALSITNNPNDKEQYNKLMEAQKSMKQVLLRCSKMPETSHTFSVYKLPKSDKNKDDENNTGNTSLLSPKDWTEEQKHKHQMSIIISDAKSLGAIIPQEKQDELMALHSNTLLNYNGQNPVGGGFAVGHTIGSRSGQFRTTTTGGVCVEGNIYQCYHNNVLALTGVLGSVLQSGGVYFPIFEIFKNTKLPGSDRSVLEVFGSDTTATSLMMLFKAHSGQKKNKTGTGPHQRAGLPLHSLTIKVSKKGIYPKTELGPKASFGSWVEAVKVYMEEMRSSEILGFSAAAASLRNLVELKESHLGNVVDYFNRRTNALSADAQAMVVAVYDPLRVALREFGRQRLLLRIDEKPSLQEVLPIVTESFAHTLVLSENTVPDSGMSFIADTVGNLPEAIIGDLNYAERQALQVNINTGGFKVGVAPRSSQPLVKAQITALIVVLKRFGFGDESVSPETRRSAIMGIFDNVLRWKWAIKMARMTNMFSEEVWYNTSTNLNRDDLPAVLLEEDEEE